MAGLPVPEAVSPAELARGLRDAGNADRVEQAASAAKDELLGLDRRARQALIPFAVGAFTAAAGLVLAGTFGTILAGLGIAAALGGMALGFWAVISAAQVRQELTDQVDIALDNH